MRNTVLYNSLLSHSVRFQEWFPVVITHVMNNLTSLERCCRLYHWISNRRQLYNSIAYISLLLAKKKKVTRYYFLAFAGQMGETAVTIATDKLQNIRVSLWIPYKRSSTHAPINSVYVPLSLQLDYIVRTKKKKKIILYLYVGARRMYETIMG